MRKRYVILDRDGTIIEDKHYLSDPDQVELLQHSVPGLKRIVSLGFGLLIVTNQSGVGRGYYTEEQVHEVNNRLIEMLGEEGIWVDAIRYCPHIPEDNCECRKPHPGLVENAAIELGFDPAESIVIGDKRCDIDMAKAVGGCSILVRTGYGSEHERLDGVEPDWIADDLAAAAAIIEKQILKSHNRTETE